MATFTDRVTLRVAGYIFRQFTDVTIERDLQNIAGRFEITAVDEQRIIQSLADQVGQPPAIAVKLLAGQACELAIDGETVLLGWTDKVGGKWDGEQIRFRFAGRDKTGDLVDCAALPYGPSEFHGVGLLKVAETVCKPFGVTVHQQVDVGAPFQRLALYPHETALSFLEKAARQRATLLVSDGVGGLLLTRGGSSRGPAPLRIGELIQDAEWNDDHCHRFSDYFVKGQTPKDRSATSAPLDHTAVPLGSAPLTTPGAATAAEKSAVVMTGHAVDPEIARWRPTVRMVRTQSGMSTVQEQAEWMLRVARGQAQRLEYAVLDWRANGTLWRPNQVVTVWDPYAGIDSDMLIAGIRYRFAERGARTHLRLVGVTAYDRINQPAARRHRHTGYVAHNLVRTATPLTAQ